MSQGPTRIKPSKSTNTEKPMDRWDLLRSGLPIDYFYRRFVELGKGDCPRCGHHHLGMARRDYGQKSGWEWCCMNCSQRWREPKITVGLIHSDTNGQKEPQKALVEITEYK